MKRGDDRYSSSSTAVRYSMSGVQLRYLKSSGAGEGVDSPLVDTAEHAQGDERIFKGSLTIDEAVLAAFGPSSPRNFLTGVLLLELPSFQKLQLYACGCGKLVFALGTFLPLFTHQKYEPPDCSAPKEKWPVPARGSIAYDWELCCGQEWQLAAITSTYFMGCFVGSFGGILLDRFGRSRCAFAGLGMNAMAIAASGMASSVFYYSIARFCSGMSTILALVAIFTLGMEWVPEGWRASLGGFFFSCSATGELLLVALTIVVSELWSTRWQDLTTFAAVLSALPLLWIPYWRESPRWLYANGQISEASELLQEAVEANKRRNVLDRKRIQLQLPEDKLGLPIRDEKGSGRAGALVKLLLSPSLWAMGLMWFTASLVYYGISLSASLLGKGQSLYMSASFSALSEVPSAFLSAWILEQPAFGRRLSTSMLYAAGGICCMSLRFLSGQLQAIPAVLGKFFVTAAFDGIYVFASEVFETTQRGTALGLCSSSARVGAIVAPEFIAFLSPGDIMVVFGMIAVAAAMACRSMLPETRVTTAEPATHDMSSSEEAYSGLSDLRSDS